jgi:hypothetical protein
MLDLINKGVKEYENYHAGKREGVECGGHD